MLKILTTTLLLCAGAARAQILPSPGELPPAVSTAPAAPQNPGPAMAVLNDTVKYLSILEELRAEVPPEKWNALQPELQDMTAKVKDALGEKIVAEIAARDKAEEDKRLSREAVRLLQSFRASLQIYYSETGGRYPETPADLVPGVIQAVPVLHLPNHAPTDRIVLVKSRKYDKDLEKAVRDTGGWLYFADPSSSNYGLLLLDCSHSAPDGTKFYEY